MASGKTTSRGMPPVLVLILAAVVPLASLIPAWQARSVTPPGDQFMGFRYMAGDHFQYAAFMQQAADDGSLMMRNPFTSEPQRGVFVLLYFWMVGLASRLLGLTIPAAWDLFGVMGGALYILIFWWLTDAFFTRRKARIAATGLFCLAGGLDWIVTLLRMTITPALKALEHPFDFFWNWSTFGTMAVPHWLWPALVLALVVRLLLMSEAPAWRAPLVGLLMPLVWFMHAYSGMVAYLALGLAPVVPVCAAWLRIEKPDWARARTNARLVAPGLLSFAVVAAYLLWARGDEVFRVSSARGFSWTDTFSVWWYPISYGLLLPLAWFGLRSMARQQDRAFDLTIAWAVAAFFLSVNPLFAGVKFQYLLFPPLALLAARGFGELAESSAWFARNLAAGPGLVAMGAALCLNAPVSLVKEMPKAATTREIYMPRGEVQAMQWLRGQPDGLVLCSYWSGNRLAWLSGKTVFVGHWFMTAGLNQKNRMVAMLFSEHVTLAEKQTLIRQTGARYIYAGRAEATLGSLDPQLPLRRVYDQDQVVIYEVGSGA